MPGAECTICTCGDPAQVTASSRVPGQLALLDGSGGGGGRGGALALFGNRGEVKGKSRAAWMDVSRLSGVPVLLRGCCIPAPLGMPRTACP